MDICFAAILNTINATVAASKSEAMCIVNAGFPKNVRCSVPEIGLSRIW
jgi:hypothetical protein